MTPIALPQGYEARECIQERRGDALYRGWCARDDTHVALRVYASSGRRLRDEARARHEVATLSQLAGVGVPALREAFTSHSPPILVLEELPSRRLEEWCGAGRPVDMLAFVRVAIQLTCVLERAHASHVIHGDVSAANIRVDPDSLETMLVACDRVEPFDAPTTATATSGGPISTEELAYVAPERTGRMNRRCDYRSDLYSLGCVFHRMLVGHPPFEAADALSMIHAHIAREPTPVHEQRPEVAKALSKLVDRLLSKEPEARYQSAAGLRADLESCQRALQEKGEIDDSLQLGGGEVSNAPRFSTHLHGRDAELRRLREAYEVASSGRTHMLVLRGDSGSGKSALVDAMTPLVREKGGLVARGRFDGDGSRAHGGWLSAVAAATEQMLLESDAALERWRTELTAGLGNIAGALVELVPDLGVIVQDAAAIPSLGPAATRARLSLALQRFVRACATPEHPLVLAFDDLHRADAGSCELFEEIFSELGSCALLVIGTCRASAQGGSAGAGVVELDPRIVSWCKPGDDLEILSIGPLASEDVADMLAEGLGRSRDDVAELLPVLERKTGNMPLVIRLFIEHASERGLIRYAPGVGWDWDERSLAAADVPDEAVGLMTARLDRLDPRARTVIGIASCLGAVFDPALVEPFADFDTDECQGGLSALVAAGLIAPGPREYRFVHNRIREAAYARLGRSEREGLHAQIGRALYARIGDDARPDQVFEAVDHLNLGASSQAALPRVERIEANLLAAKRALAGGSNVAAAGYLGAARSVLVEDDWTERHSLSVEVTLTSAVCAIAQSEVHTALELLEGMSRRRLDPSEATEMKLLRLRALPLVAPPSDYVAEALEVLRELGVRWPARPSAFRARWSLQIAGVLVDLLGPERMVRAPSRRPGEVQTILAFLAAAGPSMVIHDIRLAALATAYVVRQQMWYGRLTSPSYRLATLAAFHYVLVGAPGRAHRWAARALELNHRLPDPILGPRTEHVVYGLIQPFLAPRRSVMAPLGRVAESVRELGDPEYFQYARFIRAHYRALVGEPIVDVETNLGEIATAAARTRPWYVEGRECHAAYALLLELPNGASDLRARVAASHVELRGDAPYLSTMWMMVLCFYGEHAGAFLESERIGVRLHLSGPFAHVVDHTFYRGVAAGKLAATTRGKQRRTYRNALRTAHQRMRAWARGGPDFVHMATLLEAKRAREKGRAVHAARLYDVAARAAEQQLFPHHAALAHEYRAETLEGLRRGLDAQRARAEAARLYELWGAHEKAAVLRAT